MIERLFHLGFAHMLILGYCFTPYQRLWLYNGAPLVAFYDTLGIRDILDLNPRRPHGGTQWQHTEECMCRLRNIAMRDYHESVTTGQTVTQPDGQTDAGQSDPYVPLCFACDTSTEFSCQSKTLTASKHLVSSLVDHLSLNFRRQGCTRTLISMFVQISYVVLYMFTRPRLRLHYYSFHCQSPSKKNLVKYFLDRVYCFHHQSYLSNLYKKRCKIHTNLVNMLIFRVWPLNYFR